MFYRCWSVDFNSVDTKLLASGSDDARVKLWSANINHSVASLEAKVGFILRNVDYSNSLLLKYRNISFMQATFKE